MTTLETRHGRYGDCDEEGEVKDSKTADRSQRDSKHSSRTGGEEDSSLALLSSPSSSSDDTNIVLYDNRVFDYNIKFNALLQYVVLENVLSLEAPAPKGATAPSDSYDSNAGLPTTGRLVSLRPAPKEEEKEK